MVCFIFSSGGELVGPFRCDCAPHSATTLYREQGEREREEGERADWEREEWERESESEREEWERERGVGERESR